VRAAASWVVASVLLTQVVTLGRSVITARLLTPDDFGLFGMVATVVTALGALTIVTLDQAILPGHLDAKDEDVRRRLDVTWTAEIVRGLGAALLLAAAAYPTARFYGRAELTPLLYVASLVLLTRGLQNVGLATLRNRIEFRRLFWHELGAAIISAVVAVALALALGNVWALVAGQLAGVLSGVALSYFLHPYRPRLAYDPEVFRQVFHYGKYVTLIGVASYVTTTADNVVLGRLWGADVLGAYAVAYGLASVPAVLVMSAVGRAALPAYAGLAAAESRRLVSAFDRSLAAGAAALTLLTAPMFLLGPEIVSVLYGGKWAAAGAVFGLLSLVGLTRAVSVIISTLLFGMNKPREVAVGKAVEAAVFLLLVYPLTSRFGVAGAAYAGLVSYLLALLNRLLFIRRLMPSAFDGASRIILASAVAGAVAAAAGRLVLNFVAGDWARLLAGGAVATLTGALLLYRLVPGLASEVRGAVRSLRR
jgi:O-antigen/teichoic acid export membrane protein